MMSKGQKTRPHFKKRCGSCGKFSFIKGSWRMCMECYEKKYGKYKGKDRDLYVD